MTSLEIAFLVACGVLVGIWIGVGGAESPSAKRTPAPAPMPILTPKPALSEWDLWFRYYMDQISGTRHGSVEEAAALADAAMAEINKRRNA